MCVDGMYPVENLRWVSPAFHFFGKKGAFVFFKRIFYRIEFREPPIQIFVKELDKKNMIFF
jgi:hypothetical protein